MDQDLEWFARGGGIARCGPFDSQVKAVAAMRLVRRKPTDPEFPPDVFVWPEPIPIDDGLPEGPR
jgi:hypothetical protein